MVKELHVTSILAAVVPQVRHSNKSPKIMSNKDSTPAKDYKRPDTTPSKTEKKKPVIAFYRISDKSKWTLFPQICHNEKIAKQKVYIMQGTEKVKCIDVPEELQN